MKQDSTNKTGRIEIICGSMFSGKTEELLRRCKRAKIAKQKVGLFKPEIDHRYDKKALVSHDQRKQEATAIKRSADLLEVSRGYEVLGIDEAQFFDSGLPNIVNQMANQGKRVILAGLDMDSFGAPFGIMPRLMAIAEEVTKLQAVCVRCNGKAHFTHRLVESEDQVQLGAHSEYEPLCRSCYNERA
ncbi:thymidine kinase [bacterium]|nr:thymidine kinase [bacterium]